MITFNNKDKIFHLQGKSYSYIMCVGANRFLQHLYYGGKVSDKDEEYLAEKIGRPQANACADNARDVRTNELWCEFSSYGRGDYHEPCVIIRREDGSAMSLFRYVSHIVTDGAPELKGLPHARQGEQTLCIVLRDDFSDVEVNLVYIVDGSSDVLVRHAEYVNTGKSCVTLEKAFSFVLDFPDSNFKLLRLEGNQTYECAPEVSGLSHGIVRLQSLRGTSSHQMNAFAAFMRENTDENSGECYGVQLIYSGSWAITAEVNNCDTLRVQGGINDTAFGWVLGGGESFTAPQVALCYSESGLGGMSREYHDFIRTSILPPRFATAKRPLVINNWEATYFDFNYEKLFGIIDEAAKLGMDTFVLDDGWFGERNCDTVSLGDWVINKSKLPQGFAPVIERCKSRGIKFGLWFEPEMISEQSMLYREHPEWALGKTGQNPFRWRYQLVLDFTNGKVVDYVFDAVADILKHNEISYVKWDMNRSLSEFFSNTLPAEKQGEVAHRYVLGVYELAKRLTSAFPEVFFEGCASGGGRYDAGMLYYFPQIWTSDDTDGFERTKIQWGTSLCYPASAMSCHVSACPNHQTGRTTPLETRGAIASLGSTGYELDLSAISESEKREVKRQIIDYEKIRGLVLSGDLYRLSNPFEENYFAEMLVSKDKERAVLVGEQFRSTPNGHFKEKYLKLFGLDENKVYRIETPDVKASGAVLKNFGVPLPNLSDYGSFVWYVEEIEE